MIQRHMSIRTLVPDVGWPLRRVKGQTGRCTYYGHVQRVTLLPGTSTYEAHPLGTKYLTLREVSVYRYFVYGMTDTAAAPLILSSIFRGTDNSSSHFSFVRLQRQQCKSIRFSLDEGGSRVSRLVSNNKYTRVPENGKWCYVLVLLLKICARCVHVFTRFLFLSSKVT